MDDYPENEHEARLHSTAYVAAIFGRSLTLDPDDYTEYDTRMILQWLEDATLSEAFVLVSALFGTVHDLMGELGYTTDERETKVLKCIDALYAQAVEDA